MACDGATRRGELGDHLEDEFRPSAQDPDEYWFDLCDGKACFAIGAPIEIVKRHFFGVPDMMPPSEALTGSVYRERVLGSPPLDDADRPMRDDDDHGRPVVLRWRHDQRERPVRMPWRLNPKLTLVTAHRGPPEEVLNRRHLRHTMCPEAPG